MMEEFIDDIVGSDEAVKTEAELTAEIQSADEPKAPEKKAEAKELEVKSGAEGDPDVVQPVKQEKADADSVNEPDAVKELAAQLGWNEDHKGEDAVDAKTYILKSKDIQKSMSQHNKDLKDQLQALNTSVGALKEHNESVYQAEVKKLTAEVTALKTERRAAIELADVAKVDELDKQIDEKQKDIDAPKPADKEESQVTDNSDYAEWIKENDWYLKDDEMSKFADTVAEQYSGAPPARIYTLVRKKVQEVFPDKFEEVKTVADVKTIEDVKTPVGPKSPVESSSAKVNESSFTKADLSAAQLQIMMEFARGGIMSEEEYIKDIAKMQ